MRSLTDAEAFAIRKDEACQKLHALKATDPAHYIAPVPGDLSDAARAAREAFDLGAAETQAGPAYATTKSRSDRGAAGVRLRSGLRGHIPDEALREFARKTLGAKRCSLKYLETLRVVLGNLAKAEHEGYVLELNVRTPFGTERTMRTIIGQLRCAEITRGETVVLGDGRSQVVQCFGDLEQSRHLREAACWTTVEQRIERLDLAQEVREDQCRLRFVGPIRSRVLANIPRADVPY